MSKTSTSSRGSVCQALLALASAWLLCSPATAQPSGSTGLLNDTGQTQCVNASNVLGACDEASTGNAATHPRQDGRFGRDVASPSKLGAGAAGFDFTKVCMNGTPNCTGAANTTASPAATDWACTKDNVTNLIWSLETGQGDWTTYAQTTFPAANNSATRCGFNSGWRLPTRRELLGIVHYGLPDYSTAMIDVTYFPNTQADWYWTSDTYAPYPDYARIVLFNYGGTSADNKTNSGYVRLVRSGQ